MTQLILMRHADTKRFAPSDAERVLSERGLTQAKSMGEHLQSKNIHHVLCSTAIRARQTLDAMGIDAPVDYSDTLYGDALTAIIDEIELAMEAHDHLLVVMHMPNIVGVAHHFGAKVPTFTPAQAVVFDGANTITLHPRHPGKSQDPVEK